MATTGAFLAPCFCARR